MQQIHSSAHAMTSEGMDPGSIVDETASHGSFGEIRCEARLAAALQADLVGRHRRGLVAWRSGRLRQKACSQDATRKQRGRERAKRPKKFPKPQSTAGFYV
jgi:hypothetical protein